MNSSIYLDYAATSAVRPPAVTEAVAAYLRNVGATPGRAGHRRAVEAGRVALRCRQALATLFGIPGDPGRIAFQLNATHALNTALWGVVRPGDAIVRTRYDHNAVRRPAAALARAGVEERVLGGTADGGIDLAELESLLGQRRPARLLALPHASNVMGTVLPVRAMADVAHAAGAYVLLDVAQTAGHFPVDVDDLGVDLLAFTGHKGLLGPQGTGGLWVREGVDVEPLLTGGTGGDSALSGMPDEYPDHLEAGTLNAPGIAGLLAGVEWILARGVAPLHEHERLLKARLIELLDGIPGLRLRSPPAPGGVGIVLVTSERLAAAALARELDSRFGIMTRAGLHCAPEAHQLLGTFRSGAVRLSTGWATTELEIERTAGALAELCEGGDDE